MNRKWDVKVKSRILEGVLFERAKASKSSVRKDLG
tara:strand:- start:224 stop:328 length:105 start_codon:yes stop_codon:yes gene_type:complete